MRYFALLLLFTATALGLYFPALNAGFTGNEFHFWFPHPSGNPLHYFVRDCIQSGYYRPFQGMIIGLSQAWFGSSLVPVHLLNLLIHSAISVSIVYVVRKIGIGWIGALVAGLWMLVSQANVIAVASSDTTTYMLSTFFGSMLLWVLYKEFFVNRTASRRTFFVSVILWIATLTMRETGALFGVPAVVLLIAAIVRGGDGASKIRVRAILLLCSLVAVAILHSSLLYSLKSRTFFLDPVTAFPTMGISFCKNLGMLVAVSVTPFSSVRLFEAVLNRGWFEVIPYVVGTAIVCGVLILGLCLGKNRTRSALPAVVLGCLGITIAAMEHTSEFYSYTIMPVLAILVGIAVDRIRTARSGRIVAGVGIFLVFAVVASNGVALVKKVKMMRANSDAARSIVTQIEPYIKNAAPFAKMLLISTPPVCFDYSAFVTHGFGPIEGGVVGILRYYGRGDIHGVRLLDEPDAQIFPCVLNNDLSLLLFYKDDRVVSYIR